MVRLIVHTLASALAFFGVSRVVPGFKIKTFGTAVVVALVYGFLTTLLHVGLVALGVLTLPAWLLALPVIVLFKPLLILIAPFFLISMALSVFVVSTLLIIVTDKLIEDFEIDSTTTAIVGSLVYAVFHGVLSAVFHGVR